MTYYSQEKQDELLDTYVFKGYRKGVFVDVGAWDGVHLSNTRFFEESRGWTGVCIEPRPEEFAQLAVNRPKSIAIQAAIHEREGTGDFLLIPGYSAMLSGLQETYDPRHRARIESETQERGLVPVVHPVPMKRLETVLAEADIRRVHYLSVDTEGSEAQVLRSIDFSKVFIDVIGFESNYPDTAEDIFRFLTSKGYRQLPIQNPSDVFVIHKDSPFRP
jgi:FkbM family methyltransferase